jgi:hypothetical protein
MIDLVIFAFPTFKETHGSYYPNLYSFDLL